MKPHHWEIIKRIRTVWFVEHQDGEVIVSFDGIEDKRWLQAGEGMEYSVLKLNESFKSIVIQAH